MNTKYSTPWFYLALGLTQAAHSVEEVLTGLWKNLPVVTGFLHARFSAIPVLSWSPEGFAAANLVIVAILLGFSPFPFQNQTWSVTIVKTVAVIEIINGLLHTLTATFLRGYLSGCVSAAFLLVLGIEILIRTGREYGHRTV